MFAHMAFVKDILLGAEKRKGNLKSMCDALGINPSDIYHSDIHVSFEQAYRAWEVAMQTGDHASACTLESKPILPSWVWLGTSCKVA